MAMSVSEFHIRTKQITKNEDQLRNPLALNPVVYQLSYLGLTYLSRR